MLNKVDLLDSTGRSSPGSTSGKLTQNQADRSQMITFDWGVVSVAYQSVSHRLMIVIKVVNQTHSTIKALSMDVLAIQLPSTPHEYDGIQPMLATNIGAPTILPLDANKGSVLIVNDDVKRPLLLGMPWSLNSPAKTIFPIRINTGRDAMYPNSLPFIDRPIAAGATDTFNISLRFSASPADITVTARDVLAKFAQLDKFALQWPDRRPIGSLILATAAAGWKGNPRGWLLDPGVDINTPSGLAAFHAQVLAWADHSIVILKKMGAQGMITWDIEGEEFPHSTTYIGDPSQSEKLAPEMGGILDEYFRRFKTSGLRVGVAVRPQRFQQSGRDARQVDAPDPVAELTRKISFAKKRWGATLFYIDSNGDAASPLSFDAIQKVARAFPDVLLIPEHKNVAYYSMSAPYAEARGGHYSTPGLAAIVYPKAFSVINTADCVLDKHYDDLLSGVNRGDILMFRSWFDDPSNVIVKAVYDHSKFRAH